MLEGQLFWPGRSSLLFTPFLRGWRVNVSSTDYTQGKSLTGGLIFVDQKILCGGQSDLLQFRHSPCYRKLYRVADRGTSTQVRPVAVGPGICLKLCTSYQSAEIPSTPATSSTSCQETHVESEKGPRQRTHHSQGRREAEKRRASGEEVTIQE